MTFSERSWDWIKHGIPIRIELGLRDIENDSIYFGRRDLEPKEKTSMSRVDFVVSIATILDDIQANLYKRALGFRNENTIEIENKDDFYKFFTPRNANKPEIHGGFASSHWCGSTKCEEEIKGDLKVTIRCIPENSVREEGKCICCGGQSQQRVIFAKSY
jgi:prolyl-tRNA synthetase